MDWRKPDIPDKHLKLYEQGRAGKPKAAIRSFCLMCCGGEASEVENCTATGCPLFNLRNKAAQKATEAPNRAKRSLAAKASGRRPPKRASANGHGAQQQASILNASDSARPDSLPESFVALNVDTMSEPHDA
jgi:hypothetical protein